MSLTYAESLKTGINIFTDSSIISKEMTYEDGTTIPYYIACSGAIYCIKPKLTKRYRNVFRNLKVEDQYYQLYYDSTNNRGELYAILQGIYLGMKYLQLNPKTHINILSDSKISIYGLKEWIFNWYHNSKNGIMYGSSGEVKNQDIILDIINTIVSNNIRVRFYHLRGHQDIDKLTSLQEFKNSFYKENGINIDMYEEGTMQWMIACNCEVDDVSRQFLMDEELVKRSEPLNLNKSIYNKRQIEMIKPFQLPNDFYLSNIDIEKYRYLIKGE